MRIVSTVRDLRASLLEFRVANETVALVPTMGALHRGHMALVAEARQRTQRTVTSIFINPLQFAPTEDLSRYPRQMDVDQKMLEDHGCDLLFAPSPADMYPEGFNLTIDPGAIALPLEGVVRPGHFRGVATIVTKLLLQAMPDVALFGEKDYQQLQVIRRVVRDLDIPVQIIGVPTVRDEDGLALSSRNAYLSPDERCRAVALPQTLQVAGTKIMNGMPVSSVLETSRDALAMAGFTVDYFELADAVTLVSVHDPKASTRLLAAARMGNTRLIDNLQVS